MTALTNGVPVSGLALNVGAQRMFSFAVPSTTSGSTLTVKTSGGTGDVDIYAQRTNLPTTSSYLQKSDGSSNSETINITNPTAGTYYVLANAYATVSGAQIVATWSTVVNDTVLVNGVPVTGINLGTGTSKVYTITVPAGKASLTIKTSGGTGDADIYVKAGSAPTTSSYSQKSDGSTNNEAITVSNPTASTYYILINAYAAVTGLSVVASY